MTNEKRPEPDATGRGEIQNQQRSRTVTNSTITAADRKKYADYTVEFRQGERRAHSAVTDGTVVRYIVEYRRVPSTKTFIVYLKQGLTLEEAAMASRAGTALPRGCWAASRDRWFRKRAGDGTVFFGQLAGYAAPDPLVQLELEMLIDNSTSLIRA